MDQATTEEHKQWNRRVWKTVNQKEEQQWKEHKMQKTKLRTYRTIKQTLTFEQYLNSKDRQARQTMTRFRGGTNELRIETGRYPFITNQDRRLQQVDWKQRWQRLSVFSIRQHFIQSPQHARRVGYRRYCHKGTAIPCLSILCCQRHR